MNIVILNLFCVDPRVSTGTGKTQCCQSILFKSVILLFTKINFSTSFILFLHMILFYLLKKSLQNPYRVSSIFFMWFDMVRGYLGSKVVQFDY